MAGATHRIQYRQQQVGYLYWLFTRQSIAGEHGSASGVQNRRMVAYIQQLRVVDELGDVF
jgi:hypothetical protein